MRIQKATQTRLLLLLAIISLGILSRASTTGLPILDNYLGDGLYAAMFFILWTIVLKGRETLSALLAMVMVGSMEVFQLSNIPLKLSASDNPFIRLIAALIGTSFGYLDILSYALGIMSCYFISRYLVFGRFSHSSHERS